MNVNFINPLFLFGLPLVGIPVIIHLLTKKKARRLPFSEVKFIRLASVKVIRRHKLKELFLLLVRMLIILIFILFFARPVFYALPIFPQGTQEATSIVFILDNSYSMGYTEYGSSYFTTAKKILKELVGKLDKKDKAALLLMNANVENPVSYLTLDKQILFTEIEKSNLSSHSTDIYQALTKAYAILSDSISANKQIIIITDLAHHGYRNITELGVSEDLIKEFDKNVKFIFIDVAQKNPLNTSVSNVVIDEGVINQPVKINATVENHSNKKLKNLPISVYINEVNKKSGLRKVAQSFLNINRNVSSNKEFFYNFTKKGIYSGTVNIKPDNLTVDDKFYFKVPVEEKINVLLVDGAPGVSFYNNETYYIKLALNPTSQAGSISSQIATVKELETEDLEDFSAIILCNVKSLKTKVINKLYQFSEDGGGVIFFAGDNVDAKTYNTQLSRFIPGELIGIRPEENSIAPIKVTDTESVHTVLRPFVGPKGGRLEKANFYKYVLIQPNQQSEVLLKFSNRDPYLIEQRTQVKNRGRVLFFTSSCDKDWNNLPAKPVYVALVQQAVRYVSRRPDIRDEEKIFVGTKIKREFSSTKLPDSVKIINPEGKSVAIKPVQDKDTYKIEFEQLDTPGIYEVIYNYKDETQKEYLSVNLDVKSGESDLTKIEKNKLKKLFSKSPVVIIDNLENLDEEFLSLLKGKELSKSLLLFLISILLLEGYVANRRKKS